MMLQHPNSLSQPSTPHFRLTAAFSTVSTQRSALLQDRKAAEMEAKRLEAEEELKANGGKPDEAEREKVAISELCNALHVQMKEMTPDGHW